MKLRSNLNAAIHCARKKRLTFWVFL